MDDCFIAAERRVHEGLSLVAVVFALREALRVVGLDPIFMQALGQHPTDQLRARACVTLTAPVGPHLRNQRENVCDTKALWVWN
jgi:hypothetical protein